jgi:hypothetical protein
MKNDTPVLLLMSLDAIKNKILLMLMVSGIFLFDGCYHTRINAPGEPATEYVKVTVHSIAWGLVQENPVPDDCLSGAIDEVRVTTNFGYTLINIATLGFWQPMDIEWRCAKTPPPVPDEI